MTDTVDPSNKGREPFEIGDVSVEPGDRTEVGLPIARLVTGAAVSVPVLVLHGAEPGPTAWLDAAIHGDEVNGVEIIRRVLEQLEPAEMRGTLVAVPIVNVHGFMNRDRYLPDRRDLNRSFPGSPRGSLASQIAHLLMTEVVARCDVGIDLHTGSDHRSNLPHIRADLDDGRTRALAEVFGAAVMVHAQTRDGSLRQAAREVGARVLLFEGGEASRFDEHPIAVGARGVMRVLSAIGMVPDEPFDWAQPPPLESRRTAWVRAGRSGILQMDVLLGDEVKVGQRLGVIHDSFGRTLGTVKASHPGVVIGLNQSPLVDRGGALANVAEIV